MLTLIQRWSPSAQIHIQQQGCHGECTIIRVCNSKTSTSNLMTHHQREYWNIETDSFSFSININDQPATRGGVLSTVASLYDQLGLVAPFLLIGKRVLQEICRNGTSWDDPLPNQLRQRWEQWKDDLLNLEKVSIKCCYAPPGFGKIITTENRTLFF